MPWPGSKGRPQGGECCGRLRRRAVSATAAISEQPSTAELTRTKSRSRMTVRPARLRRSRLVSATRPILGSEFPEQVDDLPLVGHYDDVHVNNPVVECGSNAGRSLVSIEDNDLGVSIGNDPSRYARPGSDSWPTCGTVAAFRRCPEGMHDLVL